MFDQEYEQWEKNLSNTGQNQYFNAQSPELSPGRHRHSPIFESEYYESSLQNFKQFQKEQFEDDLLSQQIFFIQQQEPKMKQDYNWPIGDFQNESFMLLEDEQIEIERNQFQNLFDRLIENKPQSLKRKQIKFPKKSFCRYILVYAFRAIPKPAFQSHIEKICSEFNVSFTYFREYYNQQFFIITGYQLLKKELVIQKQDESKVAQRKKAFQNYLIWYLNTLATKDILQSKKKDLKSYLKYKNEVMSYYVRYPEQWNGNEPEWMNKAQPQQQN